MLFLGQAARLLVLVDLLVQSVDLVTQVLQLCLDLVHPLHPGLALLSCDLADAGWG